MPIVPRRNRTHSSRIRRQLDSAPSRTTARRAARLPAPAASAPIWIPRSTAYPLDE